MGKALYRKHRPLKLSQVVGQEHITTTLTNALKSGKISHAYLFTGPRGVGKTSIARILAHEVNGLPYDESTTHLDIIEIDAASNRRIDEIRELRDRIHNVPTSSKYKVYIIDEVHMLTKEAFNALLKTLEEPPEHAIFILATTEAHKLPETIVSRTQRFTFKPVQPEQAVKHLRSIADAENVKITDEALQLIVEHGRGSFRDSISLLDQAHTIEGEINKTTIASILGMAPDEKLRVLVDALLQKDVHKLTECLDEMNSAGYQAPQLAKQLSQSLRTALIAGQDSKELPGLLKALLNVPAAYDPATLLEIILFEYVLSGQLPPDQQAATPHAPKVSKPQKIVDQVPEPNKKIEIEADSEESQSELWSEVLEKVKSSHNTLYGLARMAVATIDEDRLTLSFSFPFHQKRVSDAKNQKILADILRDITGRNFIIFCVLADKHTTVEAIKPTRSTGVDNLKTISNIFGEPELLE